MNKYTTIFFDYDIYHLNKHKLHTLNVEFKFQLDVNKIKENVHHSEILGIYKIFQSDNRIISDENLKNRKGATAVYTDGINSLKMVVFDMITEKENPPVLMIYCGSENEFYSGLVRFCADVGCEIGVLIEDEKGINVVFKRQRSEEEIVELRSREDFKIGCVKKFEIRRDELKKIGYSFSSRFVSEWEKCINNYGYYNIRRLLKETYKENEDM